MRLTWLGAGRSRPLTASVLILALMALGVGAAYGGFASFAKPRKFPVGNDPMNIAAGDFDHDGERIWHLRPAESDAKD